MVKGSFFSVSVQVGCCSVSPAVLTDPIFSWLVFLNLPPYLPSNPSIHQYFPLSNHSFFPATVLGSRTTVQINTYAQLRDTWKIIILVLPLTWGLEFCCCCCWRCCWKESAIFFLPSPKSIFSFLPMNLMRFFQSIWRRKVGVWGGGGERMGVR